jgi:phospholipid/cholesterol/gamma-HCH transport system substrate-binding protein
MTMEKDAKYFTVGVFVSVTILALVGFSIWLAGVHDFDRHERYTIFFTDPVSGLDQQATVKYKGVEVGRILGLRLSPDRNDLVKVDVEVREETPVRDKTVATLAIQGVTGQSYIDLATPNNDENPPPRVDGEKYPVVKGQGSQLDKFLGTVPQLSNRFQSTLSAIDDFSKETGKMADSIRGLADKLKEDPSQIITPPARKGVEVPK